jgi:hypothetical protein
MVFMLCEQTLECDIYHALCRDEQMREMVASLGTICSASEVAKLKSGAANSVCTRVTFTNSAKYLPPPTFLPETSPQLHGCEHSTRGLLQVSERRCSAGDRGRGVCGVPFSDRRCIVGES